MWKSKSTKLRDLCFQIKGLLKKFLAWSIHHIDCSQNEEAHKATQSMIGEVFVVKAKMPMYYGRENLAQEEQFLLIGILPMGVEKAKKVWFCEKSLEMHPY